MAASAPDREKRGKGPRYLKSRPPRLSVGPPSGVRDHPPFSKDPELNGVPEPLSESDILRISRCVLQLLVQPQPRPSREEGDGVGPELVSRVLASFGSLAKQLRADLYRLGREGHPFFTGQVTNGESQPDCPSSSSGTVAPPRASSPSSPPPQQFLCSLANGHAPEQCGVAEARGAAAASVEGGGPWITRPQGPPVAAGGTVTMTGHSWGQPAALPPAYMPHALQAGPYVGRSMVWDPLRAAELEVSWCRQAICGMQEALARTQEAHALEVRRLLLELELVRMRVHHPQASPPPSVEALPAPGESGVDAKQETPQGEVVPLAAGDHVNTQGRWDCRALRPFLSPATHSMDAEGLHELTLKPKDTSLDVPGDRRQDWGRELHRFTKQSGPALQMCATGPGSVRSLDGDKVEAKIARVVAMVKEQLPTFPECKIRRHVEHVHSLQQGFSGMAFHSIVALVLGHIRGLSVHGEH